MQLRTSLNTLAAASVLAMALMTLPPDLAHAADNSPKPSAQQSCESRGYQWTDGKGCADKKCPRAGTPSEPGEVWMQRVDGEWIYRFCNGFTGKWEILIQPGTSGGPAAPPPTASR